LIAWTLGALILAGALIVIVLTNPEVDGTTASDDQSQTTAAQETADSSVPTPSTPGSTEVPTSAPATTGPAETPTETASDAGGDPLGLGVPMTPPACDETWVVILGSAIDPVTYAADVSALLSANAEAKYVLTQGACSSLRQQTPEGNQIYAVYLGPYPDQASACAVKLEIGAAAYVKRMDDTTPPEQTWTC
jgi:serine/threonine-protein kinase